jgi:hypothetical protein
MPEQTPKQNRRNRKPKKLSPFRIALIAFGLLLSLLVLKVILVLNAKPTISVDYLAEFNRMTKPTDYDPNKNAAFDYREAARVLEDMPEELFWATKEWPGDMNSQELAVLRQWLNSNQEALACLERGSAKSGYWPGDPNPDKNLMIDKPTLEGQKSAQFACLIGWNAKFSALNGQTCKALDDTITAYRLAAHFMGPKDTICQWVGLRFRVVAVEDAFVILHRRQLHSDELSYFQRQLETQLLDNRKELDFRWERLRVQDTVQRVFTDDGKGNGHLIPRLIAEWVIPVFSTGGRPQTTSEIVFDMKRRYGDHARVFWMAMIGPDRQQTMTRADELLAFCEMLNTQTPYKLNRQGVDAEQRIQQMLKDHYALQTINPLHSIIRIEQRCAASESALLATIAILCYEAEKDRLPPSLEQLVSAGYLKELPMDPYSDKPLVYKVLGKDFTLYSLGADFDDDGGISSDWARWSGGGDQVFWPVERSKKYEDGDN